MGQVHGYVAWWETSLKLTEVVGQRSEATGIALQRMEGSGSRVGEASSKGSEVMVAPRAA